MASSRSSVASASGSTGKGSSSRSIARPEIDSDQRFAAFLQALLANVPRLAIYLDNLESLLIGPDDPRHDDPAAFGTWRSPALTAIWSILKDYAEATDKLFIVASCRYQNNDFGDALIPVNLLPDDAVFRMMEWFPALRRLSVPSRRGLVDRLDGHPRAVEFANDLIQDALTRWGRHHGEWRLPDRPTPEGVAKEWNQLVEPALPKVQQKLRDDLLFDAIWDHVLDDRARRMLYRMTLLRVLWTWDLLPVLGEPDEPPDVTEATAERLRSTSLLEQVDLPVMGSEGRIGLVRYFTLHPATVQFITQRFGEETPLRLATHRRVGTYYEARAKTSPYIADDIEAGHHLFQAGEYDRSYDMLGPASDWLQGRGRVRESLQALEPFLAEPVRAAMTPDRVGRLLGTVGLAYAALGQAEQAIGFYEQHLAIARDRRPPRRGGHPRQPGQRLLQPGPGGEGDRLLRAALGDRAEIGDRRGEGTALGNLGIAYTDLGQVEKAIGFYEQRLAIAREIGDRRGEGNALGNLGIAYAALGQVEQAIGFYEQHLAIAREIGDRRGEGAALGNLGLAYADLGQVEKAIGFYEQRWRSREIGDRRGEGNALGNLGSAYAALGQVEKAIGFYEQHLAIAREIGDRRGEGTALGNLGLAYAALGQVEQAIGLLEQALQIGQEIKDPGIVQFATTNLERLRGGGEK